MTEKSNKPIRVQLVKEEPAILVENPPPNSKGKIIAIIAGLVVLIAGLGYLAFMLWFDKDAINKAGPNEQAPEAAVKAWYEALANNQPQVLWAAMPQDFRARAEAGFKKMGEAVGDDAELYQRGLEVSGKFAKLMATKQDVFLGLLSYKPKQNPAGGLPDLGSLVGSLSDANGTGGAAGLNQLAGALAQGGMANMLDPGKFASEFMKKHKVEKWKFSAIYEVLDVVINSEIKNPAWLKKPNVEEFISSTGSKLMQRLDALPGQETEDSWDKGFKAPLRQIKFTQKSWKEDGDPNTALVIVEYPPIPFLELKKGGQTVFELKRVDGRWSISKGNEVFYGRFVTAADQISEQVEQMEMYQQLLSQLGGMGGSDKAGLKEGFDLVEEYIDKIDQVQTTDELVEMMHEAVLGRFEGLLGGLAGGAATPAKPKPDSSTSTEPNTPIRGTIPSNPGGTNTLTGPNGRIPVGRTYRWAIYHNDPKNFYRIDVRYANTSQAVVAKDFGAPDVVAQNGSWIYRNMRVYDFRAQREMSTVEFRFLNGAVNLVLCY